MLYVSLSIIALCFSCIAISVCFLMLRKLEAMYFLPYSTVLQSLVEQTTRVENLIEQLLKQQEKEMPDIGNFHYNG